jgi:hypothetical protein
MLDVTSDFGEGNNGTRDPFDRELDYGPDGNNVTQTFVTSFVWALPWEKNAPSRVVRNLLGGWEVNGINTLHTGFPFTCNSGLDNSLSGIGYDTCNQVGAPALAGGRSRAQEIDEWFNTAAFVTNPIGTYGTAGVDSLWGPGFWNLDFGVIKKFRITESKELEWRGLFYNLFNHPSLGNPSATLTSPIFGQITSTQSNPRVIEFALRFTF